MAVADPARGDWQCVNEQCYNHTHFPQGFVYGSSVNCKKCGTGKAALRAGDWCCPNPQCINHQNCVYSSKNTCPKCGCAKPAISGGKGGGPMNGGMGMGMGMGTPAFCTPVQAGGVGGGGSGVAPPRPGDWHCPNESCKNHTGNVVYGSKMSCPLCGTPKPDDPVMATQFTPPPQQMYQPPPNLGTMPTMNGMGGKGGGRPGDWNCPNPSCKNHLNNVVYGSKDFCPICGTPKPENAGINMPRPTMQQTPVQQHHGMQSRPGDWHCPNPECKNHVNNIIYASKSHCPLCACPKPIDGRMRSRSPR